MKMVEAVAVAVAVAVAGLYVDELIMRFTHTSIVVSLSTHPPTSSSM